MKIAAFDCGYHTAMAVYDTYSQKIDCLHNWHYSQKEEANIGEASLCFIDRDRDIVVIEKPMIIASASKEAYYTHALAYHIYWSVLHREFKAIFQNKEDRKSFLKLATKLINDYKYYNLEFKKHFVDALGHALAYEDKMKKEKNNENK